MFIPAELLVRFTNRIMKESMSPPGLKLQTHLGDRGSIPAAQPPLLSHVKVVMMTSLVNSCLFTPEAETYISIYLEMCFSNPDA